MVGSVLGLLVPDAGRSVAYVVYHVVVEGGASPASRQRGCGAVDSGVDHPLGHGDEFFPQVGRSYKLLLVGVSLSVGVRES